MNENFILLARCPTYLLRTRREACDIEELNIELVIGPQLTLYWLDCRRPSGSNW